jgi:hypothetical protein
MSARIARNNGNEPVGPDWNGNPIPPGAMAVVDDQAGDIRAAYEAGTLELDPTVGRHYEAPPTERAVRPTERHVGKASGPKPRQ